MLKDSVSEKKVMVQQNKTKTILNILVRNIQNICDYFTLVLMLPFYKRLMGVIKLEMVL